jgi:hypothetical protein
VGQANVFSEPLLDDYGDGVKAGKNKRPYPRPEEEFRSQGEAQEELTTRQEYGAYRNKSTTRYLLNTLIELLSDESIERLSGESASLTSFIENLLIHLKSIGIIIPDVTDVRDYLMKHPDMDDLLTFVCNLAVETFGDAAELSLEVYHDPEIKDEYLILYIRQYEYQDNIKAVIKELRSKYKKALIESSGWILVTTDYNSPMKAHA